MTERVLPPPDVALAIMERIMARVPDSLTIPPEAVAVALMAYLSGVRWEDDGGVLQVVEAALSVSTEGGSTYTVRSWRGALQLLSFPTMEAWAEQTKRSEDAAMKGVTPGEWTKWFCVFCARQWEDGSEPDACPDCDHPLTRFRKDTG